MTDRRVINVLRTDAIRRYITGGDRARVLRRGNLRRRFSRGGSDATVIPKLASRLKTLYNFP